MDQTQCDSSDHNNNDDVKQVDRNRIECPQRAQWIHFLFLILVVDNCNRCIYYRPHNENNGTIRKRNVPTSMYVWPECIKIDGRNESKRLMCVHSVLYTVYDVCVPACAVCMRLICRFVVLWSAFSRYAMEMLIFRIWRSHFLRATTTFVGRHCLPSQYAREFRWNWIFPVDSGTGPEEIVVQAESRALPSIPIRKYIRRKLFVAFRLYIKFQFAR